MSGFVRFVSYHNAVPIGLSVLLLSFGAAFAASEGVRSEIYSVESRTITVDNTYIAGKDLANYLPRAEITSVTEDDDAYYVAYELTTIDVVDAVWQDVSKTVTMRVSKALLGETLDLGLHVSKELGQVVDSELARLRETQEIERRFVSTRVVATEYSGLVGRFLDPTLEELPGYVPVVTPPEPPAQNAQVAGAASAAPEGSGNAGTRTLTVLGDNPARVARGGQYVDLGVAVSGAPGTFGIRAFVNDGPEKSVGAIVLDTTYDRVWHIRYEAFDATGPIATADRYVLVGDAQIPGTENPTSAPSVPTVQEQPAAAPGSVDGPAPDAAGPGDLPSYPQATDTVPQTEVPVSE